MSENMFLKEMTMGSGSQFTENGAASYASLGTNLLDQFGKAGTNRGRDLSVVFAEQSALWNENPEMALKFPFYLRMITRQTKLFDDKKTVKVQKGQGARDESFKRLLWVEKYHPDKFYQNLWLLPMVGSWKDIWVMLSMSEKPNKVEYFKVLAEGINDTNHKDLVKKYMPRIRSSKKCTTEWAKKSNQLAKDFANFAGWTYEDYRQFKSTGKAHTFQKYICAGLYSKIDWNTIPGKALLSLVTGNFLKNHDLEESYEHWLEKQPVAKFNGYVYEFAKKLRKTKYGNVDKLTQMTIDKQFANLIETAKKDDGGIKGNVWVALDTSGSMNINVHGVDLKAVELAKSLAIYFATLNEGAFHNYVMGFDNRAWLHKLSGESFTEKWFGSMPRVGSGGTNFQSIINEIIRIKEQKPEIPESDFPQTVIVVSDMQFNPVCTNWWDMTTPSQSQVETNYEACVRKLREAGFSEEFLKNWKMVWWYCVNRTTDDFPSNMDCPGTYMISGFDPAIVTLLLGGQQVVDKVTGEKRNPTMEEMVETALTQEVLNLVH